MRFFLFLLTFSLPAVSATIKLGPFDQQKLAVLLLDLPTSIRDTEETPLTSPAPGRRIQTSFPQSGPLKIVCVSKFYTSSPFPSASTCKVHVDMSNPNVVKKNDEVRVKVNQDRNVSGLYTSIPYGKPEKDFRGWERDQGIDFEGYKSPIFHFSITCTKAQCLFRFSAKNLVP
jgi:hypothetical protein